MGTDAAPSGLSSSFSVLGAAVPHLTLLLSSLSPQSILQCTSIWVIADVERVYGASAHENMLKEAITACMIGKCSDITFVVTKMDKISREEYMR